jgi:hypothetical protein
MLNAQWTDNLVPLEEFEVETELMDETINEFKKLDKIIENDTVHKPKIDRKGSAVMSHGRGNSSGIDELLPNKR